MNADPCHQTNSLISKTWRTFLLGSAQTFGMPWRLLNLSPPQTEGSRFPLLSSNVVLFLRGLEVDPNSLQHNPLWVAWSQASTNIKRSTAVNRGWILNTHLTSVLFLHCIFVLQAIFVHLISSSLSFSKYRVHWEGGKSKALPDQVDCYPKGTGLVLVLHHKVPRLNRPQVNHSKWLLLMAMATRNPVKSPVEG